MVYKRISARNEVSCQQLISPSCHADLALAIISGEGARIIPCHLDTWQSHWVAKENEGS